jgi:hypothetical protein
MTTNKPPKDFDSVAFKRAVQAAISEEVRGLGPEEEIAYFRRSAETGPLGDWWQSIRQAAAGVNR